jgi:hypothetical protein
MCLRPSDIVDLLLLSTRGSPDAWPTNRSEFLRIVGFFDYDGVYLTLDNTSSPDPIYSVLGLEDDVASKLSRVSPDNTDRLIRAWGQ